MRGADVVLLQEVQDHPREGASRAARIGAKLGMQVVYAPARSLKNGATHGLAVLSRWPITNQQIVELPLMNLHVATERRIALAVTIETPEGPLRVYDVHLDTRLDAADRLRQLQPVAEAARRETLPVVVGGDFNTNPFAWAFRLIPTATTDQPRVLDRFMREAGFATPTAECGPTTPPPVEMRLDALYVRGLRAVGWRVDRDARASDHYPLWLELGR
jgi:endonuclease/exonuclease/phosphatase family metal-dependent hydrolase